MTLCLASVQRAIAARSIGSLISHDLVRNETLGLKWTVRAFEMLTVDMLASSQRVVRRTTRRVRSLSSDAPKSRNVASTELLRVNSTAAKSEEQV